jgi:hypothetical protein
MGGSLFASLDREAFVRQLRAEGVALGLRLPSGVVEDLLSFAASSPCYADRNTRFGFKAENRAHAEAVMGKPILVGQYFNTEDQCLSAARLRADPALRWIAAKYLESVPKYVGTNLWWTFAVRPLDADRDRHAHMYHRDVDDFHFFKYFFYLTDVNPGDGAHVCVLGSHWKPPRIRFGDAWNIRRYSDGEIESNYPIDKIVEICGSAGTGFAENTLCIHKGLTPTKEPRLLIQVQFALFDYGAMHDRRELASLRSID